jgi:drug/metabolite transporter (DMT)-like permease
MSNDRGLEGDPSLYEWGLKLETVLALIGCGAAGSLTYSIPLYLKAAGRVPPTKFALVNLIFSVFVGAVCAALFTRLVGFHWPWTVNPEPWPLAMVIGLGSNPLVPVVVRRLEGFAETFGGKTQ